MQKHLNTYELIDSGNGRKLERFGPWIISRPASQALWQPALSSDVWNSADAVFSREGDHQWLKKPSAWEPWIMELEGLRFKLSPTDFGHLGIFPEHAFFWKQMQKQIREHSQKSSNPVRVLNLFAYSGGATLVAAQAGAQVCHLDASKGMVSWARENAQLNGLDHAPIRWIVDDVSKFLAREKKRDHLYEAIILDPQALDGAAREKSSKSRRISLKFWRNVSSFSLKARYLSY